MDEELSAAAHGLNIGQDPATAQAPERAANPAGNWSQPVAYDYQSYNRSERPAGRDDPGRNDAFAPSLSSQVPLWASGATKYEWKEEYGDVAPPVPELEEELFRSEYILRRGDNYHNLLLNVTQESETQIRPVKEAGYPLHTPTSDLTARSLPMLACTL